MENEEKEQQKLDIYILLEDLLRLARGMWRLCLIMMVIGSLCLVFIQRRSYREIYEAYASFTVRVSNPLYASVTGYNEKTAEVMADTFPSILTSNLLQKKVMDQLGITGIPSIKIDATAQSSIFTLSVRDPDPQRAYDVLNAVIATYPEISEFVVGSTVLVLLDESGVPTRPVSSFDLKYHAIRGAVMGGVLWCILLFALAMLKNTIHNEEELRKSLNTPCLGQIPSAKLTRKTPYPLLHRIRSDSGFAESIRLLRLRVDKALEELGAKVLLISSAIPGEGKTTIAVNLAVALSQKGKRVLLIDCDLRNPSVVSTLSTTGESLSNENSLIDYMHGRIKVIEAIQPTDIPGLYLISGGPGGKTDSVSLLSGKRMSHLLKAARNLYDYVILDTPPCSLLEDASELSELADAGLMVIRQDYAARDQIVDGIQRLNDGKLPILGCAFNNVRKGHYGSYGGYGYGYGGYSHYYSYGYGKTK